MSPPIITASMSMGLISGTCRCSCLAGQRLRQEKTWGSMMMKARRWLGHQASNDDESRLQQDEFRERFASQLVDVSDLAQQMRSSVREYTRNVTKNKVKLVGILAQSPFHADAELYSDHIAETCREDCIHYELITVNGSEPRHVKEVIQHANLRPDVHGVLVYYPIFKQLHARGPYKNRLTGVYYKTHDDYLRDVVCSTKDVEGLCHEYNARGLFRARGAQNNNNTRDVVLPCTALSVLRILESCYNRKNWSGVVVAIVNRSEILGRPLATMFANAGATVYSIDIESVLLFRSQGRMRRCTDPKVTLEWCLRRSNIVVTGVPSPDFFLPIEPLQPGTTLVNVSEYSNVDEERLLTRVPDVRFVPHVGKVTIAVLEQNLIQLHRQYHCETR